MKIPISSGRVVVGSWCNATATIAEACALGLSGSTPVPVGVDCSIRFLASCWYLNPVSGQLMVSGRSILLHPFTGTIGQMMVPPGKLILNGAGEFATGGPEGDNGLSGKKLVIDHYGPSVPIGGGALFLLPALRRKTIRKKWQSSQFRVNHAKGERRASSPKIKDERPHGVVEWRGTEPSPLASSQCDS